MLGRAKGLDEYWKRYHHLVKMGKTHKQAKKEAKGKKKHVKRK